MARDVARPESGGAPGGPWTPCGRSRGAARIEAAVKKASHALGRVRYFTRFLEQVDAFEEEVLA